MTRRWFASRPVQRIPTGNVSLGVTLTPIHKPDEIPECAPAIVRDPDGNIVAELGCGEEYQYECPCEPSGDLTWWPIDNTTWDGEFNGTGDVIFGVMDSPEVRTGFDGAVHVTPPVSEGWVELGHLTGGQITAAIAKLIGGVASGLSWTFTHVSGETRTINVDDTSGEYVLFSVSVSGDAPANEDVLSVYDFVSSAGTLRLNIRTTRLVM